MISINKTNLFWLVIVIICVLVIWELLYKNNCYYGSKECGPKWHWGPQAGDDVATLVERIKNGTEAPRLIHTRPLVLISAIILSMTVSLYFYKKVPTVTDFLVLFAIHFGLIWVAFRFYETHRLFDISNRTQDSVTELKYQLDLETRPSP
jgi:hypothetical protein